MQMQIWVAQATIIHVLMYIIMTNFRWASLTMRYSETPEYSIGFPMANWEYTSISYHIYIFIYHIPFSEKSTKIEVPPNHPFYKGFSISAIHFRGPIFTHDLSPWSWIFLKNNIWSHLQLRACKYRIKNEDNIEAFHVPFMWMRI